MLSADSALIITSDSRFCSISTLAKGNTATGLARCRYHSKSNNIVIRAGAMDDLGDLSVLHDMVLGNMAALDGVTSCLLGIKRVNHGRS